MFKIVFSDIDGTLLNATRELSTVTIQAIKELEELDIPFILISSRMPQAMYHLQEDLGISHHPIIAYNGGLVIVDGKSVSSTEISNHILQSLVDFNLQHDVHLSLFHREEWYVPREDFWSSREINNTKVQPTIMSNKEVLNSWKSYGKGAHKIMAMGEENKIDLIMDHLAAHFDNELHLYRSKATYLEIAPKEISKLTAVELLLKDHFRLPLSQSIAFGDNYNDIEMLQGVGLGIAVGNAKPEVLEVVHMVTSTGQEDGVAQSIREILL